MEKEKGKYFVMELGHGVARVVPMEVYWAWYEQDERRGISPGNPTPTPCHCLGVTKEEATVFLKMMGLEDATDMWIDQARAVYTHILDSQKHNNL